MRWVGPILVCAACLVTAQTAGARSLVYCQKPDNAGAFLAISPGVTCKTATAVARRLTGHGCYGLDRCVARGFRCVAEWDGRFDRPFAFAHHALCESGWRWIEWDGG